MIFGITGTNGAGKGTIVDYLVQKKGFTHYSVREFLIGEIEKRKMPVNRDSMRVVANAIRAEHEDSYIIALLYAKAIATGHDALIESVRVVGEAEYLKSKGVKLIVIDADCKIRFERVAARATDTDKVDFDTFVEQERKEMSSADPSSQNVQRVMQMADYHLTNDGTLEDLHKQIEKICG